MQELNIQGKKVAVFGLGDQVSYAENYADAAGELHDVFENLGCQLYGYTSQDGYEHEDSKSIRGDKFCGLLCDMVNQEELTEERVQAWVTQLRAEGFLEGASTPTTPANAVAVPKQEPEEVFQTIDEHSNMLEETIKQHGGTGYTPYYNSQTKSTMWVSADGRSCYYTTDLESSYSP
jgi:flavodoxin I